MYLVASAPRAGGGGLFSVDSAGRTCSLGRAEGISWLVKHSLQPQLIYSAAQHGDQGRICVWEAAGDLSALSLRQEFPLPSEPCHATVAPDGSGVYTANYHAGSVSRIALDDSGRLVGRAEEVYFEGSGPEAERQEGAHPHHVLFDYTGRLIVTDLGVDLIRILDPHTLRETAVVRMPPGSGPRHTTPISGAPARWAVSGELASTVLVVQDDTYVGKVQCTAKEPVLSEGSGKPERRNYPSDLVDLGGAKVLVANRGVHSFALIDVSRGEPRLLREWSAQGEWPLALECGDEEVAVVNRDSDVTMIFGLADETPHVLGRAEIPAPTAVLRVEPR